MHRRTKSWTPAVAGTALVVALGLTRAASADDAPAKPSVQVPPGQAKLIGKGEDFQQRSVTDRPKPDETATPKNSNDSNPERKKRDPNPSTGASRATPSETKAVEHVAAEIRDSLELRKTLVVWIVEQSDESALLVRDIAREIGRVMQNLTASGRGRLQMAMISYGTQSTLLTEQPAEDAAGLQAAIEKLGAKNSDHADSAIPFAAVHEAIEKFLPMEKQGWEIMFVVVGTSSGSDLKLVDEDIAALKRAAVPVYGIGPPVPFGDQPPLRARSAKPGGGAGPAGGASSTTSTKRQFESFYPEKIPLAMFDNQGSGDLIDSGYGPFGLERLCRETGGRFFRIRSGGAAGWELDPATGEVKAELLAKYAPDYVSDEQYQQLLSESKARTALHKAALLLPLAGLGPNVQTSFPKQKDEAALARIIKTAQQPAAERDQPLQDLYDTLAAGEADRAKLTGARWQAEFDLALGLTLAAKARLDGYNTTLAVLKQGKTFANADSTKWVLEPADELAVASTIDKMAKQSRQYLERVVKEHKGTPWAVIAERELKHPAGWKLTEE